MPLIEVLLFLILKNANAVKELVVCGMLLASRGIIQGSSYAMTLKGMETNELNKSMESQKKFFKGSELKGKNSWYCRSWCYRVSVSSNSQHNGNENYWI